MKRSTPFVLCLAAAAIGLAGCSGSAQPERRSAALESAAAPVKVTSLAASDSLGGLVFTSDMALGPTTPGTRPIYAEVPTR